MNVTPLTYDYGSLEVGMTSAPRNFNVNPAAGDQYDTVTAITHSCPDFIVNAAIQSGELVELFEGWSTGEQLVVHTLYPTRTHLPPKVQRMRDFLVEQFKVPPWCPKQVA